MKNIYTYPLFIGLLFLAFGNIMAQQTPYLHSFSLNPHLFNPAAQGVDGGGVGIAYRSEFSDLNLSDDRPTTYLLNADFSPLIGDRIGIGILLMTDQVGVIERQHFAGMFGYHLIPSGNDMRFSLGVIAGGMTQKFDFGERRVNDPNDLLLLSGIPSKTVFDGGVGASGAYTLTNGSELHFDLLLPQLFTSDIDFKNDASAATGNYDVLPHVLASIGFRYQGEGFAVDPTIVYRESMGGANQKAANFDFNLVGHFLENDMLTAGAGIRTDNGGLHFMLGVKPMENLQVLGAFDLHSELGNSFEVNLNYSFGNTKKGPRPTTQDEIAIDESAKAAAEAYNEAFKLSSGTWDKVAIAEKNMREAKETPNASLKKAKLDRAYQYLATTEGIIKEIRAEVDNAKNALDSAEDAFTNSVNTTGRRPKNAKTIDKIREDYNRTRDIHSELTSQARTLRTQLDAMPADVDIAQLIVDGKTDDIRQYYSDALERLDKKPEEAKVSFVHALAADTHIEYMYRDEVEEYSTDDGDMAASKSFANHLSEMIKEMKDKGVNVKSIRLIADVQYSASGAKFGIGKSYAGEYGNSTTINYLQNGTFGNPIKAQAGQSITFWDMVGLKLLGMQRHLSRQTGIPVTNMQMEINTAVTAITYPVRMRVVLIVR